MTQTTSSAPRPFFQTLPRRRWNSVACQPHLTIKAFLPTEHLPQRPGFRGEDFLVLRRRQASDLRLFLPQQQDQTGALVAQRSVHFQLFLEVFPLARRHLLERMTHRHDLTPAGQDALLQATPAQRFGDAVLLFVRGVYDLRDLEGRTSHVELFNVPIGRMQSRSRKMTSCSFESGTKRISPPAAPSVPSGSWGSTLATSKTPWWPAQSPPSTIWPALSRRTGAAIYPAPS